MDNERENPFASPLVEDIVETKAAETPDEQIRREHIRRERTIKNIGGFFALYGAAMIPASVFVPIAFYFDERFDAFSFTIAVVLAPLLVGWGILHIVAGKGLRKLRDESRKPSAVCSAIWMISFPIGTMLGGYGLYLLLSKKGASICSAEYKRIINATLQTKVKTSLATRAILFGFLAALAVVLGIVIGIVVFEFA